MEEANAREETPCELSSDVLDQTGEGVQEGQEEEASGQSPGDIPATERDEESISAPEVEASAGSPGDSPAAERDEESISAPEADAPGDIPAAERDEESVSGPEVDASVDWPGDSAASERAEESPGSPETEISTAEPAPAPGDSARELEEIREILLGHEAPKLEAHLSEIEVSLSERVESARQKIVEEVLAVERRLREELKTSVAALASREEESASSGSGTDCDSANPLDELLNFASVSHEGLSRELEKQREAWEAHSRDTKSSLEELLSLVREVARTMVIMISAQATDDAGRAGPVASEDAACDDAGPDAEPDPAEEAGPGAAEADVDDAGPAAEPDPAEEAGPGAAEADVDDAGPAAVEPADEKEAENFGIVNL